jgi:hypothetical protein
VDVISADGSERWLDEMALADARLTVLPHGPTVWRCSQNFSLQGVDVSAFDGVAFADQDDIWRAGQLLHVHTRRCVAAVLRDIPATWWPSGRWPQALIEKNPATRCAGIFCLKAARTGLPM